MPNDPAFPRSEHDIPSGQGGKIPGNWKHIGGLTKREYFAAMAMQGILSVGLRELLSCIGKDETIETWLARQCINAADGLIAKLNKESTHAKS